MGRLTLKGFLAWLLWSFAHVYFLIGLRNRIAVAFSWAWDYMTFGRRARLITEPASANPVHGGHQAPSNKPSSSPAAKEAEGSSSVRTNLWG